MRTPDDPSRQSSRMVGHNRWPTRENVAEDQLRNAICYPAIEGPPTDSALEGDLVVRRVLIVCLWLAGTLPAAAQDRVAPLGGPPTTFRSAVEVVTLNVTVTDPEGRQVSGLTGEDFEVLEDGVQAGGAVLQRRQYPPRRHPAHRYQLEHARQDRDGPGSSARVRQDTPARGPRRRGDLQQRRARAPGLYRGRRPARRGHRLRPAGRRHRALHGDLRGARPLLAPGAARGRGAQVGGRAAQRRRGYGEPDRRGGSPRAGAPAPACRSTRSR